ncbi:ATP-binding protein [Methylobacillus pratensis]
MVIFLAGVHGVGKTFLGRPVAEFLGLSYATASSLIREERGGRVSWDKGKKTTDVDENQELLVTAVTRILEKNGAPLVLDGHFVLRNEKGDIAPISASVFRRLRVSSVVLLEAPLSVVAERLVLRGSPQSLEDISELVEAERKSAEDICKEIGVPIERIFSPSSEQLSAAFKRAIL